MKLARNSEWNPAIFAAVPLVNVLFLVVIFFTLSSRFALQNGLPVSLPFSSFSIRPPRNPQIVSISAAPVPAIFFEDQTFSLANFRAHLALIKSKDRSLIIKADRTVNYDLVMQVANEGLKNGYSVVLATAGR
jgi:biopolymer transport protein ExbD